ncbi:MAG: polysaccharide biosynthesis tyrosine autokinase [bacterium]
MKKSGDRPKKEKRERIPDNGQGPGSPHSKAPGMESSQVVQQRRTMWPFTRKKNDLQENKHMGHLIAEQFNSLKIRIQHPGNGNLPRTLLVCSAFASEGKSTVSTNLAISFAQGLNNHVLLIDCDFRKPDLHNKFGLSPEKGLVDYINGNAELPEIFLKTGIPKLALLPVGKPPPNPVDLISSERMKDLIQELNNRLIDRSIIFDSSHIKLTTFPKLLIKLVDGVILVVEAGKTNREIVLRITQDIGREKLLGIVLNGLEKCRSSRYYYNYYHNRYY